jgi:hypothetical protein
VLRAGVGSFRERSSLPKPDGFGDLRDLPIKGTTADEALRATNATELLKEACGGGDGFPLSHPDRTRLATMDSSVL